MPPPVRKPTRFIVTLLAAATLAACGGQAGVTPPTSVRQTSAPPTLPPEVSVPADGLTLAAFGFTNGPVNEFSLPRTAVLASKVDQANNVVAVLSSPSPSDVAAYLRRTLPAAGFELRRSERETMTFDGYGWVGSFTGTNNAGGAGGTSAVLLRPR
jgi:hypothetical protein